MNRYKSARLNIGITQEEVANILGVSRTTYAHYETGIRKPDPNTIVRLSEIYNVSSDYLLGIDEHPKNKSKTIWIPILGNVPAGAPIAEGEYNYGYVEIPEEMAKLGELFSLLVKGNSMDPEIRDGDVAVILQQPDAESGNLVVVRINGEETTIKRLKKQENGILLIPSNQSGQFSPIFYSKEDIQKLPVDIVGKVLEIRRKY